MRNMVPVSMIRVRHNKYGYGTVLQDPEGLTMDDEYLVRFDNPLPFNEPASADKSLSRSAYTDIVAIKDCTFET